MDRPCEAQAANQMVVDDLAALLTAAAAGQSDLVADRCLQIATSRSGRSYMVLFALSSISTQLFEQLCDADPVRIADGISATCHRVAELLGEGSTP